MHSDALRVRVMQAAVSRILQADKIKDFGVFQPILTQLQAIRWSFVNWCSLRDADGVEYNLAHTSSAHLRQRMAMCFNAEQLHEAIRIQLPPGHVLEVQPIRAVFKKASGSDRRLLTRGLSGTVVTRQLIRAETAACPACGEVDSLHHPLARCWITAPHRAQSLRTNTFPISARQNKL